MRCLALITGKLDGVLAARAMQKLGVEVEALYVNTPFNATPQRAEIAAGILNVPLACLPAGDDYITHVRDPRFGYTVGASPCLDCRIHLFRLARLYLQERRADFLVSGDVLGQRRHSQRRKDLEVIDYHAGVGDILLRPLSAKLLAATSFEREGHIDRERLFAFHGSGRRELLALGRQLDLPELPSGGECCALAHPPFAERVFELIRTVPAASTWHFELLRVGRHLRLADGTRVVVGRRHEENVRLAEMHARQDAPDSALLEPEEFVGPTALVVGSQDDATLQEAVQLLLRFAKRPPSAEAHVRVTLRSI